MIEYGLILLTAALAMLGLAEVLHNFKMFLLKPKKERPSYRLVFLEGDDALQTLNSAIAEYRWRGGRYAENIIAVYSFLKPDALSECRKTAERYNVILLSCNELSGVVSTLP